MDEGSFGNEDDRHDELAESDRERSVIEMMNGPARAGKRGRATVLWLALAFVAALFSLTTWVMFANGVNWLALLSLVILGYILIALAGMLRYKGQDPMAQFDSELPVKRRRGMRKKRER